MHPSSTSTMPKNSVTTATANTNNNRVAAPTTTIMMTTTTTRRKRTTTRTTKKWGNSSSSSDAGPSSCSFSSFSWRAYCFVILCSLSVVYTILRSNKFLIELVGVVSPASYSYSEWFLSSSLYYDDDDDDDSYNDDDDVDDEYNREEQDKNVKEDEEHKDQQHSTIVTSTRRSRQEEEQEEKDLKTQRRQQPNQQQQEQQEEEEGSRYFIIHVGPQKTASTYIQKRSTLYQDTYLKDDNYLYIGKGTSFKGADVLYNTMKDIKCRQLVHEQRLYNNTIHKCFQTFINELSTRPEYQQGNSSINILMSSEDLFIPKLRYTPEYLRTLIEVCINQFHFTKVIFVIVYRRLYEWLPSAYQQKHVWAKNHYKYIEWPPILSSSSEQQQQQRRRRRRRRRQEQQQEQQVEQSQSSEQSEQLLYRGIPLEPMFPEILESEYIDRTESGHGLWYKWIPSYLEGLQQQRPSADNNDNNNGNNNGSITVETRILNLYTNHTTEYEFFCNMIPNAYQTCQHATELELKLQKQNLTEHRSRRSSDIPLAYDQLAMYAASTSISTSTTSNGSTTTDTDSTTTLINRTKYSRPNVRNAMRNFFEDTLQLSVTDLPMICPTTQQLETLLNASIYWEHEIISGFVREGVGGGDVDIDNNNNNPILGNNNNHDHDNIIINYDDSDEQHRSDFYESYVNKKKYCFVDANSTLSMDVWKTFIQEQFP